MEKCNDIGGYDTNDAFTPSILRMIINCLGSLCKTADSWPVTRYQTILQHSLHTLIQSTSSSSSESASRLLLASSCLRTINAVLQSSESKSLKLDLQLPSLFRLIYAILFNTASNASNQSDSESSTSQIGQIKVRSSQNERLQINALILLQTLAKVIYAVLMRRYNSLLCAYNMC